MSLKENFYQALQELLKNGGLVGSDLKEKAKSGSALDSYLETIKETVEQEKSEVVNPPMTQSANTESPVKMSSPIQNMEKLMAELNNSANQNERRTLSQAPNTASAPEHFSDNRPTEERTLISKNTFIEGNIRSFANITIEGGIRGKVDVIKNVDMKGMLVGNLICNNVEMKGSSIQGNVFTKGNVLMDNDSVLLGDIEAQYASVDGRIKGNMEVGSKTEFGPNAVILGNITTGTICVQDGANIQGFVNTTFLTEHGDTAFPSEVIIDNMGM